MKLEKPVASLVVAALALSAPGPSAYGVAASNLREAPAPVREIGTALDAAGAAFAPEQEAFGAGSLSLGDSWVDSQALQEVPSARADRALARREVAVAHADDASLQTVTANLSGLGSGSSSGTEVAPAAEDEGYSAPDQPGVKVSDGLREQMTRQAKTAERIRAGADPSIAGEPFDNAEESAGVRTVVPAPATWRMGSMAALVLLAAAGPLLVAGPGPAQPPGTKPAVEQRRGDPAVQQSSIQDLLALLRSNHPTAGKKAAKEIINRIPIARKAVLSDDPKIKNLGVEAFVTMLGQGSFKIRAAATKKLGEMGWDALPVIRKAENSGDLEVGSRGATLRGKIYAQSVNKLALPPSAVKYMQAIRRDLSEADAQAGEFAKSGRGPLPNKLREKFKKIIAKSDNDLYTMKGIASLGMGRRELQDFYEEAKRRGVPGDIPPVLDLPPSVYTEYDKLPYWSVMRVKDFPGDARFNYAWALAFSPKPTLEDRKEAARILLQIMKMYRPDRAYFHINGSGSYISRDGGGFAYLLKKSGAADDPDIRKILQEDSANNPRMLETLRFWGIFKEKKE